MNTLFLNSVSNWIWYLSYVKWTVTENLRNNIILSKHSEERNNQVRRAHFFTHIRGRRLAPFGSKGGCIASLTHQ